MARIPNYTAYSKWALTRLLYKDSYIFILEWEIWNFYCRNLTCDTKIFDDQWDVFNLSTAHFIVHLFIFRSNLKFLTLISVKGHFLLPWPIRYFTKLLLKATPVLFLECCIPNLRAICKFIDEISKSKVTFTDVSHKVLKKTKPWGTMPSTGIHCELTQFFLYVIRKFTSNANFLDSVHKLVIWNFIKCLLKAQINNIVILRCYKLKKLVER